MDQVFVYWDNSNVFHEAQRLAEEREGTPGARYLVRIHFENLLRLAEAGRPLARAVAAGSVPPEMQQLWNRMENRGVQVRLFDRGERDRGKQEVPDRWLQLCMLEDGWDNNGDPGIVALLTGAGAGYAEGQGFHRTLERMHRRGWRVEGGGALVGAFVQPGDAPMGGGERRVRAPGRPLRGDHLPRAVPPGSSARAGTGSSAARSVAPPHGVTRSGPAGVKTAEGAVALPATQASNSEIPASGFFTIAMIGR